MSTFLRPTSVMLLCLMVAVISTAALSAEADDEEFRYRHREHDNFCDPKEVRKEPMCTFVEKGALDGFENGMQSGDSLVKRSKVYPELVEMMRSLQSIIKTRKFKKFIVLGLREQCWHTHRHVHVAIHETFQFLAPEGTKVCFYPDEALDSQEVTKKKTLPELWDLEDSFVFFTLWSLYTPARLRALSDLIDNTKRSVFVAHRIEYNATFSEWCKEDYDGCEHAFQRVWNSRRLIHWREFRCHPAETLNAVQARGINGEPVPQTYNIHSENTFISTWPTSVLPSNVAVVENKLRANYNNDGSLNTTRAEDVGVVFVGSAWKMNHLELLDLAHAVSSQMALPFRFRGQCGIGPLCDRTYQGADLAGEALELKQRLLPKVEAGHPIDEPRAIKLQTEALLVPAIQGRAHFADAPICCYVPDRVFKALSFGQIIVSNNPCVKDTFADMDVTVADGRDKEFHMKDLIGTALRKKAKDTMSDAIDRVVYALARHSYLHRFLLILQFQEELAAGRMQDKPLPILKGRMMNYCPEDAEWNQMSCVNMRG